MAITENLAVVAITIKYFDRSTWPMGLIIAALGGAAVTHTLFWTPVMLLTAAIFWLCVRRKSHHIPEPFLLALFVVLISFIVVPMDLELSGRATHIPTVAIWGIGLLLAVGIYVLTRAGFKKLHAVLLRRILRTLTTLAAIVIIISGIAFLRSPFFNPGTYQAPRRSAPHTSHSRPNVLLIVLDTIRPDYMSCYNSSVKSTPFLGKWAQESIVFDKAFSNGMWTVPSHASMFTGLSLREHGMNGREKSRQKLDKKFPTLAELLNKNGYATASFSNNPWISRESGLARGFDTCQIIYHLRRLGRSSLEYLGEKYGISPFLPWFKKDTGSAITSHLVAQWLDAQARDDAPFFLFINYMEGHLPYLVPKKYRSLYMNNEQVRRSYELRIKAHGRLVSVLAERFNMEESDFFEMSDREILKLQYKAAVRYLDDRVRELISMLKQRGILDNTLVIITSDHGEYLDTHGQWAHYLQLYDEVTNVVLMIHLPGTSRQKRVATPVLLSDLYQTVLKAALGRADAKTGSEVYDLIAMAAGDKTPRTVISEYAGASAKVTERTRRRNNPVTIHRTQAQTAAQDGRFKYIVSADGLRELYDLENDPGELHNLFGSRHTEQDRLADYVEQWLSSVPSYQPSTDEDMLDSQTIKVLQGLGYLDE